MDGATLRSSSSSVCVRLGLLLAGPIGFPSLAYMEDVASTPRPMQRRSPISNSATKTINKNKKEQKEDTLENLPKRFTPAGVFCKRNKSSMAATSGNGRRRRFQRETALRNVRNRKKNQRFFEPHGFSTRFIDWTTEQKRWREGESGTIRGGCAAGGAGTKDARRRPCDAERRRRTAPRRPRLGVAASHSPGVGGHDNWVFTEF